MGIFGTSFNLSDTKNVTIGSLVNSQDSMRLRHYNELIDFWKGDHWRGIYNDDTPEVTQNWCRRLVNDFSSYEFTGGVSYRFDKDVEKIVLPFLNDVWEDNDAESLLSNLGIYKGATGDAYLLVEYEDKNNIDGTPNYDFEDPFNIYDKGRINISVIPPTMCFPTFKDGFKDVMESCTLMIPKKIPYKKEDAVVQYKIEKRVYYNDVVEIYDGKELVGKTLNQYGVIPIVHFKNLPDIGSFFGVSDLEDLITLNIELNTKGSDLSEIIDYHASPITCIYGCKTPQISKDANKVWSNLPVDGKVENVELKGNSTLATTYLATVKDSIHEIGALPKLATGASDIPANISGVALQVLFGPLVKVVTDKRKETEKALRRVNMICIKIGMQEGLLSAGNIANKTLYKHDIIFGDILPKDTKTELENVQQEMKMGLSSRRDAMIRLKKDSIEDSIAEIDKETKENPFIHGITGTILSAGQILVNQNTGDIIAKGSEPVAQPSNPKSSQPDVHAVGTNKEGGDLITPSSDGNKNPGKQE